MQIGFGNSQANAYQGVATAAVKPQSIGQGLLSRLRSIDARLEQQADALRGLEDVVVGPAPQNCEKSGLDGVACGGFFSDLNAVVASIERKLTPIQESAARVRDAF